jgi:allantoicase
MHPASRPSEFAGLVNLADERLGARAVATNDEFFAAKESLLRPQPAIFDPDRYTDRGKWMDGWESRRRREPGHDWCIVRLGLPGVIRGVDIDTSHFLGNHPPHASLDAATVEGQGDAAMAQATWTEILPRVPLAPGAHNPYSVASDARWTHARLNIYPDGGVARLRIYGVSVPDWASISGSGIIDLASVVHGGGIVAANDMFFGASENMLMPWVAESMRDGWETRRRRGPGHDWSIVRLGRPGRIRRLEVDTKHFKGNYPDRCSVEGGLAPSAVRAELISENFPWKSMLPPTKLQAHANHVFDKELADVGPVSHVRINIFPDGGVSRLRVFGTAT